MKTFIKLIFIAAISAIISCNKNDEKTTPKENYSSVNDFFTKNGVSIQTYTVSGATGGSFTSPQGTKVTIPANAFVTQTGAHVIGNVTIQFKDIYQKSDMLLSNMPTTDINGRPLKSGGEFFIKAISGISAVKLDAGKKITVAQPAALTGGPDTVNKQQPFIAQILPPDTTGKGGGWGWGKTTLDSVRYASYNYIFSFYRFKDPVDSGSWCNSDNDTYFSAYTQTSLTLHPNDDVNIYGTQVFLIFSNLSSMVHVYYKGSDFPYLYAPLGLACTMVAVGVKNGVLYSSFVPITISANKTVNFSLSQTTTSAFITQLKSLN